MRKLTDTNLAHFFRMGILAEAGNDDLHQPLCCLRLLHQIIGGSTAQTDTESGKQPRTRKKRKALAAFDSF